MGLNRVLDEKCIIINFVNIVKWNCFDGIERGTMHVILAYAIWSVDKVFGRQIVRWRACRIEALTGWAGFILNN